MSRSFVRSGSAAGVAAVALALSACVVVPIDPRTGQPYPYAYPPRSADGGPRTTVVMPPASPAPPQPSVLIARLYPLNVQANKGGLLSAVVVANAFGPKGVNAQCEYVITGPALGTGVCLFSDGATFQLHFG